MMFDFGQMHPITMMVHHKMDDYLGSDCTVAKHVSNEKPWLVGLYRGLYYPGIWGL